MKKVLSIFLVVVMLASVITFASCDGIIIVVQPNTTTSTTTTTTAGAPACKHDDPEKIIVLEAVSPTCETTGLTEGEKCLNCDTIIVPQEILSKEEHTFGAWSLLENEIEEVRECTVCGQKENRYTVIFDTESPVKIRFYSTMGKHLVDVITPFIEAFEKMYPNITVEHTQPGGYDEVRDTIKTELTVNEQPNLAYCYPDHVAMYNLSGTVVNLDQFINHPVYGFTEDQKNDIIEGFYEEGKQFGDGYMYTLPFSKSTEVLYYNKTFFDTHSLEVPTTWDEMEVLCARIKQIDPDCIPLGYDSESNLFITLCEQFGSPYTSSIGEHYLFDNDTNRAFVKRIAEWYDKGYITTKEMIGWYTSGLFVEQECYMSIGSSAGAIHQRPAKVDGAYPFDVGIAPIPQVDVNNPKVIVQGPSLVMLDCGMQENIATWLFMQYLVTNVQLQEAFANASGYNPVLESVVCIPEYAEKLENANGGDNITYLSMKVCLEYSNAYFSTPAFIGSSNAKTQVENLLVSCMVNSSSDNIDAIIDDAFKKALQNCQ